MLQAALKVPLRQDITSTVRVEDGISPRRLLAGDLRECRMRPRYPGQVIDELALLA
jgi:hypothetical protein